MAVRSLWEQIEPLLDRVERPSRYLNHEYNARDVSDGTGDVGDAPRTGCAGAGDAPADAPERASDTTAASRPYRAALLYPDTYELGQSNQAIAILYDIINAREGCIAERVFLPWVDMIALMRERSIPLFTLESTAPVASFDLLGITLPHELAATNILEALDLAGIPLKATERTYEHPLVLGGGPCAFNPEPVAAFFDALVIGEGEEVIGELIAAHRACQAKGATRAELLATLAAIDGVYVPSFYEQDAQGVLVPRMQNVPHTVRKRVIKDFDAYPVVTRPVVPFAEVVHDRLTVEVLRGCTRGCRFCQAGMLYRPVRERTADTIVDAVAQGLTNTGYEEVSLTSLSTTDHSQIEQILRRLNHLLEGSGIGVSIPSQRLDAFGLAMAQLVAGEKKTGLTLAPEAGTQRLRDSINKNITEDDLLGAVSRAYAAGWRRCKLYFMIGLPTETDEDIRSIASLANRAYTAAKDAVPDQQRGGVRMGVSVAVFVPKPHTPYQWQGQIAQAEVERRLELLRASGLHKGIDLHWHDPATSRIEAALSRAGRESGALIEAAWRAGARFDAWSERFNPARWEDAARTCGLDISDMAKRSYAFDEPLPWNHLDSGVTKEFLLRELNLSLTGTTSTDCAASDCLACGVCSSLDVTLSLGGERTDPVIAGRGAS